MKKTGVELIAAERQEQIEKHGFDLEKDMKYYQVDELVDAALYALTGDDKYYPTSWGYWWRDKMIVKSAKMPPQDYRIEKLKIAGALIAAEIDRIENS